MRLSFRVVGSSVACVAGERCFHWAFVQTDARQNVYDLTRAELRHWLVQRNFNGIHAGRSWSYLYLELAVAFEAMADVPARVRAALNAGFSIGILPIAVETDSSDGFTRKYLLTLHDRERIETVLMRYTGRVTACISS